MSNERILEATNKLIASGELKTQQEINDFLYSALKSGKESFSLNSLRCSKNIIEQFKPTKDLKELPKEIFNQCKSPIEQDFAFALFRNNIKFICQKPIGKYIMDLFIEPNICIECDGSEYHTTTEQNRKDDIRNRYLINKGYFVRHFTGKEIYNKIDACVKEIKDFMISVVSSQKRFHYEAGDNQFTYYNL